MVENIKKYVVNGSVVWQGSITKLNGVKQEKTIKYHIRPLNIGDAEQMGVLSESIYNNLKEGEECFIHKHSKEYYFDIFKNKNLHYIGVFIGNHLVAMSYLKICNNKEELKEELPNSSYNFFDNKRGHNIKIASLGADSVLPEYRGNSLNSIMINYRLEQASLLRCSDCTSIVDRNNRWNMTPYFANRFNLFSTAIDPSDGGTISLLHKPMGKTTVLSANKTRITLPYNRFNLIDSLIKKGFIGIEFDKTKATVTFAHSSYYTPNTKSKSKPSKNKNQTRIFAI